MKIIRVLEKGSGSIFSSNSGSWFPVGTVLPDVQVEKDLHALSVHIFNCTCNTWTVNNMLKNGFLAPTETDGVYEITHYARTVICADK